MAAVLAGANIEEEYLWSCTLSAANKEYVWEPKEPEDFKGEVKPGHRLLVKTAILMPSAKKDEVNIVEVECEGYNKKRVKLPIVAMKAGVDCQKYIDILVPGFPATIKIVQGEGPLHLVGSHCVENFADQEDEDDDDDEMEASGTEDETEKEAGDKAKE